MTFVKSSRWWTLKELTSRNQQSLQRQQGSNKATVHSDLHAFHSKAPVTNSIK